MALNVTTAVFSEGCNTATASPSLAQWDKGQVLQLSGLDLPDAYQVEFSTVYTRNAIPMIGNASGVQVPNELLQRSAPITACIVLHGTADSRETEYWVTIHITPRKPPETTTPDPEQEDALDQAIAALEAGAAKAEAAAEAIQDMNVEAETLAEGSPASVEKTVDPETGAVTLSFGLPRGNKGNPGTPGQDGTTPDFRIGTVTTLPPESPAEATITGTPAQPVLNLGIPQGEKGEPGGGSGTSDYTQLSNKPQINGHTLDGNKSASDLGLGTYSKPSGGIPKTDLAQGVQQSLNKADSALQTAPVQSVAGKTGAVNLGAGDVGYSELENYDSGTVGAKLGEQSRHLSDKAPVIINTASGDVASFADGADGMQMRKVVGTIATPEGGSGWTECKIYNEPHNSLLPQLVNWQQKLNNALSSWAKSTYVGTREEDGYIFVRTSSSSQRSYYISQNGTILQDHVCIAFVTITNLVGNRAYKIGGQDYTLDKNIETNVGFCVKYATDQSSFTVRKESYVASSGDIFKFKNIMLFDLTEMLGAEKAEYVYGLEQSRTGAGVEWFKTLFPKDFYDYSVSAEEQVTVSDVNDEQYRSLSIAFTDPSTGDPITVNNGTITLNENGSADLVTSDDPSASYHWQNVGELNTFYGSNGVWINTGSILSCEYRADTKLYVDALTARDTDITESIAPVENGATSTQAYAQGAYFWHDTKFCKALTAIASGATFTLGTNYQETTVAAELLAAQN